MTLARKTHKFRYIFTILRLDFGSVTYVVSPNFTLRKLIAIFSKRQKYILKIRMLPKCYGGLRSLVVLGHPVHWKFIVALILTLFISLYKGNKKKCTAP